MDDTTAERLAKRLRLVGVIRTLSTCFDEVMDLIDNSGERKLIIRRLEEAFVLVRENCTDTPLRESNTGISLAAIRVAVDEMNHRLTEGILRLHTSLAVADGETDEDIDVQTLEQFKRLMICLVIPLNDILSSHYMVRVTPPVTDAA